MHALFVHGMGRSALSGWPMLRLLRRAGIQTSSFSYFVSTRSFTDIQAGLTERIAQLAHQDEYFLIGHSLGGVLIRAAVTALPASTPLPHHMFLLGSPTKPARLAQVFSSNPMFRAMTRDCGSLLGSDRRMQGIGIPDVQTTGIAGTKGLAGWLSPFQGEQNDGIVSLSEVSAGWLTEQVPLPLIHSMLPASSSVARIILERMGCNTCAGR